MPLCKADPKKVIDALFPPLPAPHGTPPGAPTPGPGMPGGPPLSALLTGQGSCSRCLGGPQGLQKLIHSVVAPGSPGMCKPPTPAAPVAKPAAAAPVATPAATPVATPAATPVAAPVAAPAPTAAPQAAITAAQSRAEAEARAKAVIDATIIKGP